MVGISALRGAACSGRISRRKTEEALQYAENIYICSKIQEEVSGTCGVYFSKDQGRKRPVGKLW